MNGFLGAGGMAAHGRTRVIRVGICVLAIMVSWWLLAGLADATTVAPPTISGVPQQGNTLTAVNSVPSPPTATVTGDTWLICNPTCPATGPAGTTLLLTAADVGATIEVVETATDMAVPPSAPNPATATSAPTAAVLPLAPVIAPPTISGTAQQGLTLTAVNSTPNTTATVTDMWLVCKPTCPATGPAGTTLLLTAADVGATVKVVETANNAAGLATATSAPTAAVLPAPPANSSPPAISGTPQQGQTLTVTHGVWTNNPTAYGDQWEQCDIFGTGCQAIPGQTGLTYTLGPGDVGHTIAVAETATNPGSPPPPTPTPIANSAATTPVTATSATSVVAFSSNPPKTNQTVTLIATIYSSSGNANPSGSVTFFNGSNAIGGCSGKPVNGGPTVTVVCPAGFGAGAPQITAVYTPGPGSLVDGSTSAPTSIAIGRDSTSVSLAVTSQVNVNNTATYSAALVLPTSNSGPIDPTGSIAFLDGGQPIPGCASQQMTNLTATCTQSYNSTGTHQISAVYSGDGNFAGSTSSGSSVQVVKSGAKTVLGFVKSALAWSFFYHPTYTQVMQFVVSQIAKGTTVVLQCQGNGCAFKKVLLTPRHKSRSLNLLARFDHKKLKPGTRVTVWVTHPNWVGKFFSFKIRAGAAPVVKQTCIGMSGIPGHGC
jgi:hypothetical protein